MKRIEAATQAVLDARSAHPGSSLADLYDPLSMPPDLSKAHKDLDMEVERAYRKEQFADDDERTSFLFGLHNRAMSRGQTRL